MGKKGKHKYHHRFNIKHEIKRQAKLERNKVNPSHRCLKCNCSLKNTPHHFYCDDCNKHLPSDRPIDGVKNILRRD